MTISVYMERIAYKFGGAESYTANLIEALQKMYPGVHIRLITERLAGMGQPSTSEFIAMQNRAYGTSIAEKNVSVAYFRFREIKNVCPKHRILRLCRIIYKEFLSIQQAKNIIRLSKASSLFINTSFKIISGKAEKNICVVHFPLPPVFQFPSVLQLTVKTDYTPMPRICQIFCFSGGFFLCAPVICYLHQPY